MSGYLCVWKMDGVFRWSAQRDEAARSRNGERISRRWSVDNQTRIRPGDRIFLKTSGELRTSTTADIERGLIASGVAILPPRGLMPIQEGSAVYLDHPYENKTEELDHTVQPKNFVNIRFDAILVPDEALTVRRIEGIGNLRTMYWNIPRSGVRIGPRRNQGFRGDLMPQLEEVWAQHLDGISFPIGDDEEERTISTVLGREGRRMLRVHRFRERWPGLAEAKRTEALARLGNLECQVCGFDFLQKYGPHGDGFMEVHHRTPLMDADPDEGREVSTEDVDLVCANCHRMIHWKELLPLEKLRSYLRP